MDIDRLGSMHSHRVGIVGLEQQTVDGIEDAAKACVGRPIACMSRQSTRIVSLVRLDLRSNMLWQMRPWRLMFGCNICVWKRPFGGKAGKLGGISK